MLTKPFVTPSEIERETGFGKDQLRKWRQRFGFPPMEWTTDGKAAFSRKSVDQLHLIKRLLEAGFRPAQVVGRTAPELEMLKIGAGLLVPAVVCRDESTQALIEQLRRADLAGFRASMAEQRAERTLVDFVSNTVTPLLIAIGDAWWHNEMEIHHQHLCTCWLERQLHVEISKLEPRNGLPSILFALPPGEHHFLGLLMAEAVLAEQGARTNNIGSGIPLNNLKLAAISGNADVVALSFSFAFPARDVIPTLRHLRRLLPLQIQIWAGGAGLSGIRKHPKGVRIFTNLGAAVTALNDWPLQPGAPEQPVHSDHLRTPLTKTDDSDRR